MVPFYETYFIASCMIGITYVYIDTIFVFYGYTDFF